MNADDPKKTPCANRGHLRENHSSLPASRARPCTVCGRPALIKWCDGAGYDIVRSDAHFHSPLDDIGDDDEITSDVHCIFRCSCTKYFKTQEEFDIWKTNDQIKTVVKLTQHPEVIAAYQSYKEACERAGISHVS